MIVETRNSKYEIDFEGSRVRRTEGVNPPATGTPDGVWLEFLEAKRIETPMAGTDSFVWYFTFNREDFSWMRTSPVTAEVE